MKNLVRYVLAALVCTFIFGATTNVKADERLYIREIYKKMDNNLKTLTSLKTGVRMEKYNSQLKEVEDRREGTAWVIPIKNSRDANFRLDWEKGSTEKISVLDGKYKLYQPNAGQVIEGKNSAVKGGNGGAANTFKLISMSAADLRANFNAEWHDPEVVASVYSAYKMTLTPKTPQSFQKAEVWVNEEGMVVQFKIYEKNGDWTNVLLISPQRNAKISKSELALKIPAGTKVVKG